MLEAIYKIIFHRYILSVIFFSLIGTKIIFAQSENLHSFEINSKITPNSSFIDLFPKSRTPYLYKGDKGSVGILLKIDNKLRKQKDGKELALIEDHFVIYKRYNEDDIFHPIVMSFESYKEKALEQKAVDQFYKEVVKKMKQTRAGQGYGSRSLTLLSRDIAGTNLALNIDGNISSPCIRYCQYICSVPRSLPRRC